MPRNSAVPGATFELNAQIGGRTQKVVITELGASLRALEIDGVNLVQQYPTELPEPMSAGAVLVPWPNRIAGGVWELDGMPQQLPINEPARGHAIHGLLRNVRYTLEQRTDSKLVLSAQVHAREGYPFDLATRVEYELLVDGLSVRHVLSNSGVGRAPVAVGTHPYLCVGDVPAADLKLVVNAESHIELDEGMIPTGVVTAVEGTSKDYRSGKLLGAVALDDAWTDVVREVDGSSLHYVQAPDGALVELRMDAAFGFIQVYTTYGFPGLQGPVAAVAMEPMTAPANTFNSGEGLHWLEPEESWNIGWGLRLHPATH